MSALAQISQIAQISWLDYTVAGIVIGNVYALLAVGLAMMFGVANLINFAHGSIYTVGAYMGWTCMVYVHLPLAAAIPLVVVVCAGIGVVIERVGLRPLGRTSGIAPLLATIGIGLVLDQTIHLVFSPDPRALPSLLPDWRMRIGGGSIGTLDVLIAGTGLVSAGVLYGFLRFTRLGWAVRATAQDQDAAQQMGVDINRVNMTVFAIASALGGIAGLLVGMYYNNIDPNASFQITVKGIVAIVIGGMSNVPGAIAGGLILGLTESYGIALFGSSYRNLFAFMLLIVMLMFKPNGIFARGAELPPEPMTGTFMARSRPVPIPTAAHVAVVATAVVIPFLDAPYLIQVLTNVLLYGMLALSLTLVAGTVGQVSLGHAALLAIGAYASALASLDAGFPIALSLVMAGVLTAVIGTALIYPSFRLRGHYVSISTLAIGEIVALVILNWTSVTRGPLGVVGIPPLSLFGYEFDNVSSIYLLALAVTLGLALLQGRLLASHLGRTWRSIREDDVAARACGVDGHRYKALAFAVGGFIAGLSGAISAHLYSYINHETFNSQMSLLALTIVILGGLGNVTGALIGSLVVVGLPEMLRLAADYRVLIYGVLLLLLIRFRPQGLLGTV